MEGNCIFFIDLQFLRCFFFNFGYILTRPLEYFLIFASYLHYSGGEELMVQALLINHILFSILTSPDIEWKHKLT